MKSDNAILGWLSFNGVLQATKSVTSAVEPYLASALTISQIAVAVASVVLIIWKIRTERKKGNDDNE